MGAGASSADEGTKLVGQNESTNASHSKQKLNPKMIRGDKGALRTDGEDISGDDIDVGEDKKAGLAKQTEEDIAYNEIRHWSHDQKVKRFALYIIFGQFDKVSYSRMSVYSIMKCNPQHN